MRLSAFALDYDGTITDGDALHRGVGEALEEARAKGIVLILATGRTVVDLRRVAGDLRLFDAVVAENGAVLAFPVSGRTMVLAPPPPALFLEDLRRQGVSFQLGECVVEMQAEQAQAALSAIRTLEVPLTLLFNRGRLMVLPQGISKATGLHAALRSLELSEHNVIAVGNAENDHALLQACGLGVAVGWGSSALKAAADMVLEGTGPAAVADYIRSLAAQPVMPLARPERHRLLLGTDTAHRGAVWLEPQDQNLLIMGDPRSGKSWVAGLLAEQFVLQRYSVCLVDPEGDYASLAELPGVVVLGGEEPLPRPHDLMRAFRRPDASAVVDLSHLNHDRKADYIGALVPMLNELRRQIGRPHRVVLDEAHQFLRASGGAAAPEPTAYTLLSYRPSLLPAPAVEAVGAVITTRTTDPSELGFLEALVGKRGWPLNPAGHRALHTLALGDVQLYGPQVGSPGQVRLAPRLTPHVRHRHKYLDMPVPEYQAFVLTGEGLPTAPARARTLRELVCMLETCTERALRGHLSRGDLSRWVADVFGDQYLAARLGELEELSRMDQVVDPRDALIELIESRYEFELGSLEASACLESARIAPVLSAS